MRTRAGFSSLQTLAAILQAEPKNSDSRNAGQAWPILDPATRGRTRFFRAKINSKSSGRNTSASFAAARNASYFRAVSSFSIEGIVAVNFIFGNKGIGYGLLIRALKKTKKVLQQLILYKRISIDFQYNFLGLLTVIVKQGA